ncbi:MAG: tRNA pseudouridine(38-40) synthase TruA [Actinomycetota bacterium]
MATIRLLVAYDGTGFRGLAPNDGVRTVVGELRRVLEPLIGPVPDVVMSGRTDAGVHAWGQMLSLVVPDDRPIDLERIQKSVNSRLGPEVVLRSIERADDDFSARFSATGRRYRYLVVNRDVPDPFLARTAWWVPTPLDLAAMTEAAGHVIGEHDFSSFCRRPKPRAGDPGDQPPPSLVRRVFDAHWLDLGAELGEGVLRFDIGGSAFCHQMVRSIVGFLVAVGTGKRQADELPEVLAAKDRAAAEQPAPSHGLTLWAVDYDGTRVGMPNPRSSDVGAGPTTPVN